MRKQSIKRRPAEGRPQRSVWTLFRRCCSLFRPYRWRFLLLLVLLTAVTTLDLVGVRLLGAMVDEMTSGQSRELTVLFLVFLAIVTSSAVLGFAQSYLNEDIGQTVVQRLRSDLHRHLQRLPVSFYTRTRTGEVLSRVLTDVNAVQAAVSGTFTDFLSSVMALAIAFVLMASLDLQMALVTFLVLPLWVYPTVRVGRRMRTLKGEWHDESARMHAQLDETLSVSGSMLVKAFGRADHENERFETTNGRMRDLALRHLVAGRWFNMGTSLFGAVIPGVVYWYGGRAVVGHTLTTGEVVAFAMLAQRVFGPFATLARLNTTLLSSAALFERIFDYMDLPVEIEDHDDAISLPAPRGNLEFENVHFHYPAGMERDALQAISFTAPHGSTVALVGPSGAGKTTLTYLIQRFYDPQTGAVRIDGHDLRDLTMASVNAAVGAVMQETYLFHTTLGQNIRYGRLDANDDEVHAAAASAGLGPLIDSLPDGLDTVVGERGFRLSGGEKQRVAIARTILKDPPILLLDEATSSLDARLEREIQEATDSLAATRTTIVIAHRLSTVTRADLILVLDSGRIVEQGAHRDLLDRNGLYATLYHEQFVRDRTSRPPPVPVSGGH